MARSRHGTRQAKHTPRPYADEVTLEQKTSLFLWMLLGVPATITLGRGLYLVVRPNRRKSDYSAFEELASPFALYLLLFALLAFTHLFMVWGTFPVGQ